MKDNKKINEQKKTIITRKQEIDNFKKVQRIKNKISSTKHNLNKDLNAKNKQKLEKKEQKKKDKKLSKWIIKNNKRHPNEKNLVPQNYVDELICLENVNKYVSNGYNNIHILKDINLSIKEGEFVVIYGPSGSGKTTLLTLISALDRPTNGICYLFGVNSTSITEHQLTLLRQKNVGYIFQQYGLLNDLTVYDNIMIAGSLQKDKSKQLKIDMLLKSVGMYEYMHKKASTLSGGQAQRVAICRALIKNPKVLFGDEPTGAVHSDATKQILQIFKDVNKEYNTTIVLVTHNDKMLQIASRIIKVDGGKIVQDYHNNNIKSVDEIEW